MQVAIMGLDVVVRKKLLPKFLFQLLLSLNLGFSFPQSLNLQLLPPRSCLTSQTSCCRFNFHGFWHIIANKDLLNLVKPIHKLLVIQATICRYLILYPLRAQPSFPNDNITQRPRINLRSNLVNFYLKDNFGKENVQGKPYACARMPLSMHTHTRSMRTYAQVCTHMQGFRIPVRKVSGHKIVQSESHIFQVHPSMITIKRPQRLFYQKHADFTKKIVNPTSSS